MPIDQFPKYLVMKCLNEEELKTNCALPAAQVKVTTDLDELAKDEYFTEVVSSKVEDSFDDNILSDDIDFSASLSEEHLSDTDEIKEPEPKKAKISIEVHHYSSDETKPYDRILMVEDTKFYIQSEKLIEHSGYFRSMLTSDFKEKEQEIISIKVFDSEKIKLFLDVVYKPDNFAITDANLVILLELFRFFEAVRLLIELLKEKKVFDQIADYNDKLIVLANEFNLHELTNAIEEFLIDQINTTYRNMPMLEECDRYTMTGFVEPSLSSLRLAEEYGMNNLMDLIDAHLTTEFTKNVPYPTEHLPYMYLLKDYRLVNLTRVIEAYALTMVDDQPFEVNDVYFKDETKVEMIQLKKAVDQSLLKMFNSEPPTNYEEYELYARECKKYELVELKKAVSASLELVLKENNENSSINPKRARELAFEYDIEPMKSSQEDLLIAEFIQNQKYYIGETLLKYFHLPRLKDIIENFLISKFSEGEKEDDFISELNYYCRDCKMEKLKNCLETWIITDFRSNHNFQYLKYAWSTDMKTLKEEISNFFKRNITVNPIVTDVCKHIVDIEDQDYWNEFPELQKHILRIIFTGNDYEYQRFP